MKLQNYQILCHGVRLVDISLFNAQMMKVDFPRFIISHIQTEANLELRKISDTLSFLSIF